MGSSKMNKGIVKEGILGVIKLRWNSVFKNYRKRVKNKPAETKVQNIPANEVLTEQ